MSWKDSLPPELKEAPALKDVADVNSLAKQFVDQQSFLGTSLRIPGKDASDKDRQEFNTKLREKVPGLIPAPNFDDENSVKEFNKTIGVPDDPKGYKVPEKYKDFDDLSDVTAYAHEAGMTQRQFEKFVSKLADKVMTGRDDAKAKLSEEHKELQKEWGSAFEDKKKNIEVFLKSNDAPEDLVEAFSTDSLPKSTMMWLDSLVTQIGGEHNQDRGDGSPGKLTPAQAQSAIDEILGNRDHAYWNKEAPGHESAKKRMLELTALVVD
jgi:hypothetical protein